MMNVRFPSSETIAVIVALILLLPALILVSDGAPSDPPGTASLFAYFIYHYQTLLAGIGAIVGGFFVVRGARHQAKAVTSATSAQIKAQYRTIAERDFRERTGIASSIGSELIDLRDTYRQLINVIGSKKNSTGEIDKQLVEFLTRLRKAISNGVPTQIFDENANKIGLIGSILAPSIITLYKTIKMDVESSDLLFQDEVPADKQYYRDIAFRCHFLAIALFKFCIPDEDFHPTFDPRFDWIEVKDWYENIPPSASTITGLPMIKWPDEILKQHKLRREGRRIVGEQEPQSS